MSIEQIELGNLIRKKRKSLGLTLSDLAGDSISVPTISNIERGAVHNVSDEKIAYLLEKLGLNEQAIQEMKESDTEVRESVEHELSIINNLIETKLFDLARSRIGELEKQDAVNHENDLSVKLQLAKANLYRQLRQWGRAERMYRKVIQMAGETELDPQTNIEAEAYRFLAHCAFYRHQDCEQALRHSASALDAFDPAGDRPYLEGRIYLDKAVAHYHLEAFAPSFQCLNKARDLSEETHDMRTLAIAYNMQGTILKRQKMYSSAVPLYKKAIDISTSLYPDQDLASTLFLNLGDTYYHAGEYESAKQCYDVTYELCQTTKDQRMLALVYSSYGEIYFETKEYDKAAEFANRSVELNKKFISALEYMRVLILKANVEMCKKSEKVIETCQEGINLADRTKQYEQKKEFHFILAKYYNKIGDEGKFMQETRNMFDVESLMKGRLFS